MKTVIALFMAALLTGISAVEIEKPIIRILSKIQAIK